VYVRRPWWLHWSVQVLITLAIPAGAVVAVAKRLQRPPVNVQKVVHTPTMAELAEAERLVTVIPPKTRETLVVDAAPFQLLDRSSNLASDDQSSPAYAVKGSLAIQDSSLIRKAVRCSGPVASAGWDGRDPNDMTRDELDVWFKSTNRALFLATGSRPQVYAYFGKPSGPSQQVVDYAAINGMVTHVAKPGAQP
jgi:hypothetical protein